MTEFFVMAFPCVAGLIVGFIFYGGLWWTVQKVISTSQQPFWLPASFLIRTLIALTGFYAVYSGSAQNLLSSLLGFVLARIIIHRLVFVWEQKNIRFENEGSSNASQS